MRNLEQEKNEVIYVITLIVLVIYITMIIKLDFSRMEGIVYFILAVIFIVQCYMNIILLPRINAKYNEIMKKKVDSTTYFYVPFVNETFVYGRKWQVVLSSIFLIIASIFGILYFIPLGSIISETSTIMNIKVIFICIMVGAYLAFTVIRGIAYTTLQMDINAELKVLGAYTWLDLASYISLVLHFLPLLRINGITQVNAQITRLYIHSKNRESVKLKKKKENE